MLFFSIFAGNLISSIGTGWASGLVAYEALTVALIVFAALATVRAPTRLTGIISIGVVGIGVTLFFVFFSAPDLALTQLLIEVLTVVLLILVFYRIPPETRPDVGRGVVTRNWVMAILVGIFGFTLALVASGGAYAPSISDYFLLNSIAGGHGGNVVNVILVDFRGYDTMGEITVLAIAALGGYALLRSPRFQAQRRENSTGPKQLEPGPGPETASAATDPDHPAQSEGDAK